MEDARGEYKYLVPKSRKYSQTNKKEKISIIKKPHSSSLKKPHINIKGLGALFGASSSKNSGLTKSEVRKLIRREKESTPKFSRLQKRKRMMAERILKHSKSPIERRRAEEVLR